LVSTSHTTGALSSISVTRGSALMWAAISPEFLPAPLAPKDVQLNPAENDPGSVESPA
jgi:hypothetical protein